MDLGEGGRVCGRRRKRKRKMKKRKKTSEERREGETEENSWFWYYHTVSNSRDGAVIARGENNQEKPSYRFQIRLGGVVEAGDGGQWCCRRAVIGRGARCCMVILPKLPLSCH